MTSLQQNEKNRNIIQLFCDEGFFQCCEVTAAGNFAVPSQSWVTIGRPLYKRGSPFCEGIVESVSHLKQCHPYTL